GKMSADRLFGDPCNLRELGRRQGLATDQCGKDVCAGAIADQRGDADDVRAFFHRSMLAEPWMRRNQVWSVLTEKPKAAPWPSFASFAMKSTRSNATHSSAM